MPALTVAAATAAIQANLALLPAQRLGLRQSSGCVLAEPIMMERDQPPFDRVTMDGIAIRMPTAEASRKFRIAGTQAAGAKPLVLNKPDECIEVMTGAELPLGCDCVIPLERLQRADDCAQVEATLPLAQWLNVHRRGSDAQQGNTVLQPGQRLQGVEIAVMAAAGYAQALVRPSPRIALISTGDELIEPGQPIESWQVRRSNTYALHAALQSHGHAQLTDVHLADDLNVLRTRLQALLAANEVLILSGGVSMGKFDFVPQALNELNVRCVFHGVAQRPGKPLWFGVRSDGRSVFALPGNPVSTFMCLHRYVLPALLQMMGGQQSMPEKITLAGAAAGHTELTLFMPVKLTNDSGITRAQPSPTRGSGDFISLLGSDGFVELPTAKGMIDPGTPVPLFRW